MPRIPHWERHLASALSSARTTPFALGYRDCATWVFELRRMLTGDEDVAALWRGRYSTATGAALLMRRLGWSSLEEMGRDLLGEPLTTPLLAQRGDILLGGDPIAFGICAGRAGAFLTERHKRYGDFKRAHLCSIPLRTRLTFMSICRNSRSDRIIHALTQEMRFSCPQRTKYLRK